jgi:peptide-methionine (S)-S-oxide reductase
MRAGPGWKGRPLARLLVLLAAAAGAAGAAGPGEAVATAGSSTAPAVKRDTAIFAGGCFWCVETAFENQPGVLAVVSGYAGGRTANPTYEEVGRGGTGHAEAVEVTFDPARTTYPRLLELFWTNIDPTQANAQFCDRGDQYRSAIFWRTEAQRRAALASKQEIERSGVLRGGAIVTQIVKAGRFHPAEEYHQDFWKKDPDRYFSYRKGCGRDERLRQIWGERAGHSLAY